MRHLGDMTGGLLGFLGGIGLFLFGMETMTAALREIAGEGLRRWLLRMTQTPLRGVLTGAAITALVQSSSAVTVMTIGFVGAGLLGFAQALGVLYGANIGTTATGWVIAMVGMKLQIGTLALPLLFVAALAGIFGEGRLARMGRMLAGLSLLFIGLDMMQAAMKGMEGIITPDQLPGDGWAGRILLVGLGLAVSALMQSSSAGVALALVLLGSGAISFAQSAAMVIGMNLGTTLTGLLASLGGGVGMRRTAMANLLFNAGTAVLAFPLLDIVSPVLHGTALGADDQTALVLFHTGFNLLGALVFLPLTHAFAGLVERLVPDRPATLAAALEPQLLSDTGSALDAAARTVAAIIEATGTALQAALAPADRRDLRRLAALAGQVDPARMALENWLAQVRIPTDRSAEMERMTALMHLTDHLSRLAARAGEMNRIAHLADSPRLSRPARAVVAALVNPRDPARAERLADRVQGFARRHRRGAMLREHAGIINIADVFRETDALRWLDRVSEHAERIAHYRRIAEGPGLAPA
jgi:phosphate:Na+ symporter